MAQFRSKRLDLCGFLNVRILRDHTKRYATLLPRSTTGTDDTQGKSSKSMRPKGTEFSSLAHFMHRAILLNSWKPTLSLLISRQALRYIIRNTTLPGRTRAQAQLQLSQMHCYTRPTQIKNRCIEGGKGRGVLGKHFRMARVRVQAVQALGQQEGVQEADVGS